MAKPIKVGDETHSKLKYLADLNHRTIGGQIDFLMEQYEQSEGIGDPTKQAPPNNFGGDIQANPFQLVEKNRVATQAGEVIIHRRTAGEVIAQIKSLEMEIEGADFTNQDPDYWDVINGKKAKMESLWQEWHEVTGR